MMKSSSASDEATALPAPDPTRSSTESLLSDRPLPSPESDPGAAEVTNPAERHTAFFDTALLSRQYVRERTRYIEELKRQPGMLRKLVTASVLYLTRRMIWSFGFFPIVIAFWLPLVFARFNPVVMVNNLLPSLQSFVQANPQAQAAALETVFIAWFSIGFAFTIFDLILTPFRNPLEQATKYHMQAWLALRAPGVRAADIEAADLVQNDPETVQKSDSQRTDS
jgi:hypothetical protein